MAQHSTRKRRQISSLSIPILYSTMEHLRVGATTPEQERDASRRVNQGTLDHALV